MEDRLRILLLEDVVHEAALIERALRKEGLFFSCMRVDTEIDFVAALNSFQPDVILSDHGLPQFNSIEAMQIFHRTGLNIPFILVTGTVSEEFAVNCLKQGADDYILKTNLSRLPTAIVNSLDKRNAEIKKKIADQEIYHQNELLVRSNEGLTKLNAELDSFVYSVSHNIRSPLASVLGLINIAGIDDHARDGHFEPYLKLMEKSVHRLDETLKEILDYSRNARTEVMLVPIDFESVFEESIERLKYIPGVNQIDMQFNSEEITPFYSDSVRIALIFNSLLSNAIKYADFTKERSFIKVDVRTTGRVEIRIEDNGVGIAHDQLPKIFAMFYRATLMSDGAGLGLFIVKESVDKLNGKVTVESNEGVGSVFTIELPVLTNKLRIE